MNSDLPTFSTSQSMQMAWRHYAAGTREDAAMISLRVLDIQPRNADALHLLGILAYEANDQDKAVALISEAIRIHRKYAPMHGNLSLAKLAKGDLNGAAASARKALVLDPSSADAHRVLGLVYYKRGNFERAIGELERAQRLGRSTAELQSQIAQAREQLRKSKRVNQPTIAPDRAGDTLERCEPADLNDTGGACARLCIDVAAAFPTFGAPQPESISKPGGIELRNSDTSDSAKILEAAVAQQGMGNLAAAEALCRQVISVNARNVRAHQLLGVVLLQGGNVNGGLDAIRRSLELNPDQPDICKTLKELSPSAGVLVRLAAVFSELGRDADALSASETAVGIIPNEPVAHFHYATALSNSARFADSLLHFRRAIELGPRSKHLAEFWHGLGTALALDGQLTEALQAHDAALLAKPDNVKVHVDRAMLLLKIGDFDSGWNEYEWRHKLTELQTTAWLPDVPQWRGECLEGKTIALISEQGFGDTIQFIRYAPLLARRGARVVVVAEIELQRLLICINGIAGVHSPGARREVSDYQCRLMSLPHMFQTTLDSIPNEIPYITAEPSAVADWSRRFGRQTTLRVGLVWAGQRRQRPGLYRVDLRRSFPLSTLAPLFDVAHVLFYSLQKGVRVAECGEFVEAPPVVDHPEDSNDFYDEALLISNLDLVISVDTAAAHLAGAMGKPTWLLSRYDCCWRWLTDRTASPWYPTMRIFSQPKPGDWASVILRVKDELQRFALEWRAHHPRI